MPLTQSRDTRHSTATLRISRATAYLSLAKSRIYNLVPRSYPASPQALSARRTDSNHDNRHRSAVLKRVRSAWIHGVLNHSHCKAARIELGLKESSHGVEDPLNAIVQIHEFEPEPIWPGTPISKTFDKLGSAILLLGAPGAGKTTLLLELAEQLIDRAERDENERLPVV